MRFCAYGAMMVLSLWVKVLMWMCGASPQLPPGGGGGGGAW